MFSTLTMWRKARNLGIGDDWPWRTPLEILRGWKVSYNLWGRKEFLKDRIEHFLALYEWYLPTEYTKDMKRQIRITYLRSRIDILEWRIKYLEEKTDELD